MKAVLEFNLPEEVTEHLQALQGAKWEHVAWDMDNYLRDIVKYSEDSVLIEGAQKFRKKLGEIIDERGLMFNC